MNAVLDFIRGIAPWVIPAILLVLFAISAAKKDKKDGASDKKHRA